MIFSPVVGELVDLYGPCFIMTLSAIFLLFGFGGLILVLAGWFWWLDSSGRTRH
jgi:hypothetical protein